MTHHQSKDKILARIAELQEIQKRQPPTSRAWRHCSERLAPLFKLMAILEPSS